MVLNVSPEVNAAERTRSAHALTALCNWAAQAFHQPLPEAVRARAALVLMDDLGAMVAASGEPEVMAACAIEQRASGAPEATIFTKGAPRADRISAAVANGMAATWCELDEGYRLAPCHAGACVLPALLAEAEATGATCESLLKALAIGYDITARFARAFPFSKMSVHPHAAYATIGAAAGLGIIRGLTGPQLLSAITGAASMTFAGPYGHAIDGALVRNAWTAAGAWIGFRSVDWAMAGIAGIPETAYDVFCTSFKTRCLADELDSRLGEVWAISDGYHKIYACCQYAHAMIEASLELHERLGPEARDSIETITVETHPRGLTLTGTNPPTVLAAKFSMPHAAASAARLANGGQTAFSSASLQAPDIAALREKVTLAPFEPLQPWPNDRPSRVTWVMKDGARHSAESINARGGADQPFDEPTLIAKLTDNTLGVLPGMVAPLVSLLRPSVHDSRPWRDVVQDMRGVNP